jgi:hypothetical protein
MSSDLIAGAARIVLRCAATFSGIAARYASRTWNHGIMSFTRK